MTMTMRVLRIMADGKARSTKELAAETGMPPKKVASAILSLAYHGMAEASPVTYQLNARGLERAKFTPKTPQQRKAEHTARRKEARNSDAPKSAAKVVAQAKASRDPLSMAWGNVASVAA
jgi:hypothetical protein